MYLIAGINLDPMFIFAEPIGCWHMIASYQVQYFCTLNPNIALDNYQELTALKNLDGHGLNERWISSSIKNVYVNRKWPQKQLIKMLFLDKNILKILGQIYTNLPHLIWCMDW